MKTLIKLFKIVAWLSIFLVLSAGAILLHSRYIAPYAFSVTHTTVQSPYIIKDVEGLKIIEFADTHLGSYYSLAQFSKVVDAINAEKPDVVIFAGDLIDSFHDFKESTTDLSALLASIDAPFGKFCVYGNHDYGGGAEKEYPVIMADGGFKLLVNENFTIDALKINIIGIDDVLIGYGDLNTIGTAMRSYYNIVIAHEPDIADELLSSDADLILSAHTHGRQINIGLPDDMILPPYGRNYVNGKYALESPRSMTLYVTRGIGTTQLPLRFNSKPEISLLTLKAD